MSRYTEASAFNARRAMLMRELAVETLADPHATDADRAHAREALLARPLDVERLDERDLAELERLLARCEGAEVSAALPVAPVPEVELPGIAQCGRCSRFTDDDLVELDAALTLDVG